MKHKNIYYLLTESEVITEKSQTKVLILRGHYIKAGSEISCTDLLSIIWPFHYGQEPVIN